MRWLELLEEYEFEIKYIKGKENGVVDALSQRVHVMHATTIRSYEIDLVSKIVQDGQLDQ